MYFLKIVCGISETGVNVLCIYKDVAPDLYRSSSYAVNWHYLIIYNQTDLYNDIMLIPGICRQLWKATTQIKFMPDS